MNNMINEELNKQIIPFGKHKGKSLETLAKDTQYCEWLLNQDWFRDKYQTIYQIVINNFGEPNETPEHNTLQVKFLDDDFCLALANLYKWIPINVKENIENIRNELKKHEINYRNLPENYGLHYPSEEYSIKSNLKDKIKDLEHEIKSFEDINNFLMDKKPLFKFKKDFEIGGWDVAVNIFTTPENHNLKFYYLNYYKMSIEIKTNLGDDYPAILRQMKSADPNTGKPCLVYDNFTAIGAKLEDIKKIFATSNFRVFSINEIEAIKQRLIEKI
jgi:uncharacterized protein (DUF3820 family)